MTNEDEENDPQPLVDEQALRAFLEERLGAPETPTYEVARKRAGRSNETFFVTWGTQELVLRRPPRGVFLPTAHDVLREYEILSRLEGTEVRAPTPVVACDREEVIGVPFYLMERIHGTVLRKQLPEAYQDARTHPIIAHELIDALAELHTLDWEAHDLGNIGKRTGYLTRQLDRWQDQWARTRPRTQEVRDVPALDEVADHLVEEMPESQATTMVHGDYKLDNVLYNGTPPRLVGILDWEMATLGDPLADLGWLLSFHREPSDPTHDILSIEPRITETAGFPPRSALIERYEEATGFDAEHIRWYVTLATWKLAILLEGSYARHLAGDAEDPFFAAMEQAVPVLAQRALAIAEGERAL
ncbi:MAG: phosphotransferase family protein [Candidatus Thermoplasmatota archaeon]|nr:phosphotransferase family protein [Candidatus Thermoplasmatota archaeon]